MDIHDFCRLMEFDQEMGSKLEPFWQTLLEHSSETLPDFMKKEFL